MVVPEAVAEADVKLSVVATHEFYQPRAVPAGRRNRPRARALRKFVRVARRPERCSKRRHHCHPL